jgi:hypothetical protein
LPRRKSTSLPNTSSGASSSLSTKSYGLLSCPPSPILKLLPPQIWSSLPFAKHISITSYAEESLSFDIKAFEDYDEEDLGELQTVHQLGRWFGHYEWRELEGKEGEIQAWFVPSAELRAMYPDN